MVGDGGGFVGRPIEEMGFRRSVWTGLNSRVEVAGCASITIVFIHGVQKYMLGDLSALQLTA